MSTYAHVPLRRLMKLAANPEVFGARDLAGLARNQAASYAKANPDSGMRIGTQPFTDDASAQRFLKNNPIFAQQARTRISDAGGTVATPGRITLPNMNYGDASASAKPAAPAAAPAGGSAPVSSRAWNPIDVADFARGYAQQAGLRVGKGSFADEASANKFLANNPRLAQRAMQDFKNTSVTTAAGTPFQLPAAAQRAPTAVAARAPVARPSAPGAPSPTPEPLVPNMSNLGRQLRNTLQQGDDENGRTMANAGITFPKRGAPAGAAPTQGMLANAAPAPAAPAAPAPMAAASAPRPPVQLPAAPVAPPPGTGGAAGTGARMNQALQTGGFQTINGQRVSPAAAAAKEQSMFGDIDSFRPRR